MVPERTPGTEFVAHFPNEPLTLSPGFILFLFMFHPSKMYDWFVDI